VKQNIYDVPGFFKGYQRMRDNKGGLNEILEQLAMLSLLPDVKGSTVLDLGCGAGELCRRISDLGAKQVTGADISTKMLELAQKDVPAGITYLNQAMEELEFSPETFDLVVSSLAFHYVANLDELFAKIFRWLKVSGLLVFSTEHPIVTCSQGIHHGWIKDDSGKAVCWPVDNYSQEGKRESHWFVSGVIKYHRTIASIMNALINSGFTIKAVSEPAASDEDERLWPVLKEARRRPPFLMVKAAK
jgi:ubiquinone/menaquinone biosynthesis C-methylase UbiE